MRRRVVFVFSGELEFIKVVIFRRGACFRGSAEAFRRAGEDPLAPRGQFHCHWPHVAQQ